MSLESLSLIYAFSDYFAASFVRILSQKLDSTWTHYNELLALHIGAGIENYRILVPYLIRSVIDVRQIGHVNLGLGGTPQALG